MATILSALQSRPQPPAGAEQVGQPGKIIVRGMNFYYGAKRALEDISIDIPGNLVTAFIGPSGCGKSTFLRTLDRMNDITARTRSARRVGRDGRNTYGGGAALDPLVLPVHIGLHKIH